MDQSLIPLFADVERYVISLIGNDYSKGFTKQENKVLALQNINRLNIHLGKTARSKKDENGSLHLLQMYVNNLTVALKNDNVAMMKSSIASIKNIMRQMEKEST